MFHIEDNHSEQRYISNNSITSYDVDVTDNL